MGTCALKNSTLCDLLFFFHQVWHDGEAESRAVTDRKKSHKKAVLKVTRKRGINRRKEVNIVRRDSRSLRKLELKKRATELRTWQAHMEAARQECIRLEIGAVKYLSDKNDIPQLPDCPLTLADKTRLAHNLKIGKTPRLGEHMQHLTDAEEHDVSVEMVETALITS